MYSATLLYHVLLQLFSRADFAGTAQRSRSRDGAVFELGPAVGSILFSFPTCSRSFGVVDLHSTCRICVTLFTFFPPIPFTPAPVVRPCNLALRLCSSLTLL